MVLDLIARDARGREVKNLKPADVEIYEDGARQDIRSFRMVTGKEVMKEAGATGKRAAGGTLPANPLPATNLVFLVFHNLDPNTQVIAIKAAKEFLKYSLGPNTWVSVFSLDTALHALEPFTTDRAELLRTVNGIGAGQPVDFTQIANAVLNDSPTVSSIQVAFNGNPAKGGTVSATQQVTGGELSSRAVVGADVANGPSARAARGEIASQRREFGGIAGMQALDQMNDMIAKLGTLPGRKSVLLFSPGLMSTGDPDQFSAMVKRANQAGVTVYAVDVNGLTDNSNGLAADNALSHTASLSAQQGQASGSAANTMERMRQGDYTMQGVRTSDTQATLRVFSDGTGGFLIGSTNDFRKSYERVLEDLDTHYEAVYHPSSDKYDGRLRTIQVKLLRPALTVESRSGYFAVPALGGPTELKPYEMTALAALNVQPAPHAFNFRTASYQFRPGDKDAQRGFAFEIPASDFTFTPEPALKKQKVHVSMLALLKDGDGQVVDKFSEDYAYEVPDADVGKVKGGMITFTHPAELPPGLFSLETSVIDGESGRASTAKLVFNNPARKGLGLSSAMLVQRLDPATGNAGAGDPFEFQMDKDQRRRVVPELRNAFTPAAKPAVYFVVYPDKALAEKPAIQVEFLVDGHVLAKQDAELPAPDATGAIPMVVGAVAKPGHCELRITARQGEQSTMQNLYYTVVAQ